MAMRTLVIESFEELKGAIFIMLPVIFWIKIGIKNRLACPNIEFNSKWYVRKRIEIRSLRCRVEGILWW